EGLLIDPIGNPRTVRIYTRDTNANNIIFQDHINPQSVTSQVLPGNERELRFCFRLYKIQNTCRPKSD
ncbi:6012_t:CDS:2, partial [Dentiscutata erythropus]